MTHYEYHALKSNALPSPEQFNEFGAEGWRLVQIIDTKPFGEAGFVIYFMREAVQKPN